MGHQQLYWSHPRKFGQGSRSCRVCSNRHGLIRKYGLNMCRQCFRQYAKDIGFIKVRFSFHLKSGILFHITLYTCKQVLHK
uniref:Small ribosomal subunit protein uS14 n=1 Tax=Nothobranchius furzeri TaxID=105023 RepID=A0A8C6LP84_NOTFU